MTAADKRDGREKQKRIKKKRPKTKQTKIREREGAGCSFYADELVTFDVERR